MELFAAALAEPFRDLYLCITARVKNQFKIHSNYGVLDNEMESLLKLKQDVDEDEALIYRPRAEVQDWSQRVGKLKNKFDPVQAAVAANGEFGCIRSLDCLLSSNILRWLEEAKQLIEDVKGFQNIAAPEAVEPVPGPSVVGQSTASRNLEEIMKLLKDDDVRMIGVWGMGGVGKTTLVLNLNNRLKESEEKLFSIVIWVVVSQHGTWKTIQTKIADRLEMTIGKDETEERVCSRLCRKLKEGRFLLILDDLWNVVDLDKVGIPRLENLIGSKIIITSRLLEVCNRMGTDCNFKVLHLSDEEAWKLFAEKVGEEVVNNEEIKQLAKEVVEECHGLPLALTVVGASMRNKRRTSQWEDALGRLRSSNPLDTNVKDKVFKPLKWSYDCLESTQDEPLKACFLFFCLFEEDEEVEVDSLAQYWLAEGLLNEHKNYRELNNRCETIVERLKDSCLLESGILDQDGVRMHDVVRDVGIWIATSEDEYKSIICARARETQISVALQKELVNSSSRVKRVSIMRSDIESLPNCEVQCPETTTLLLRHNKNLREVPYSFLKGFQALRILDLHGTKIESLPDSLVDLGQLRALILRFCKCLSELPPLAALGMLQVLDCSGSGITKLPHDFEKLTNLRELDLYATYKLRSIPADKISKLCSLEYLNMNGSAAKCGFGKGNEEEMHFEELLELNHLMTLHIQFKGIPNVTIEDVYRFHRIKQLVVYVYFEGLHFSGDESVGWLLRDALDCNIDECKGVELMLRNQVRNNAPFANLKDLKLSNCCISIKTSPLEQCVARCDLMPNLEQLWFIKLSGFESISDFSNFLGLRFTKLEDILVEYCYQLEHLFTVDNEIILPELQYIDILGCKKLKEVFKNTFSYNFAPKLKYLTVRKCDMLQKLPLGIQYEQCTIKGEQTWWDKLEWDSNDSKIRVESSFTPLKELEEDIEEEEEDDK